MQPIQSANRIFPTKDISAKALDAAFQSALKLIESEQLHADTSEQLARLVNAYAQQYCTLSANDAAALVHIVQALQQLQQ